jgi:hypothetical protein
VVDEASLGLSSKKLEKDRFNNSVNACDLIESKPIGAHIILTDSLASIEG